MTSETLIHDRKTILLVEDNPDDVFAFKYLWSRSGIQDDLRVVTNGEEALAYLSGTDAYGDRDDHPLPDLILLDLKLPFLNGLQLLSWMQGLPQLNEIPVVILSGSDEKRDHNKAEELGATAYVVKPMAAKDLEFVRTLI